jgi:hypothetical protein
VACTGLNMKHASCQQACQPPAVGSTAQSAMPVTQPHSKIASPSRYPHRQTHQHPTHQLPYSDAAQQPATHPDTWAMHLHATQHSQPYTQAAGASTHSISKQCSTLAAAHQPHSCNTRHPDASPIVCRGVVTLTTKVYVTIRICVLLTPRGADNMPQQRQPHDILAHSPRHKLFLKNPEHSALQLLS